MEFVGRGKDLQRLKDALHQVASSGSGRLLSVRGRRQVGKSRLLTEFVEREGLPYLYFTALKNAPPPLQMAALHEDVHASRRPLSGAPELFTGPPADWSDFFGKLRLSVGLAAAPTVVVLDELPWAVETDATLEGRLQVAWDRQLEKTPLLLIVVGSDLAMMQRLTAHDRPLYGRTQEIAVRPFDPAECHAALGSGGTAVASFDAHLVTGGYPRLVEDLRRAGSVPAFVTRGLRDENSSLVAVGQRSLDAEFPPDAQARRVLRAIGSEPVGKATFSNAAARLGPTTDTTTKTAVARGVELLRDKRVLTVDVPFGAPAKSKLTRYRVVDPYLSLWLRFVEPHLASIARGRADLATDAFTTSWTTWRGMAIEPLVREAVLLLGATRADLRDVELVGGWWNRENNPEVDLVAGTAETVQYVGSIKWRDRKAVTTREIHDLAQVRAAVPGAAAAKLLTVCPAGLARGARSDLHLSPEDLLAAW